MDDQNEKKNEVIASVFSLFAGLVVLALVGWLVGQAQVSRESADSARARLLEQKSAEEIELRKTEMARRIALASEKREAEKELAATREELENLRAEFDTMAGERDAWKLNLDAETRRTQSLEEQLTGLGEQVAAAKTEREQLRASLEEARKENAALSARLEDAGDLKKQLAEANRAKKESGERMTAALAAAESAKRALNSGADDLKKAGEANAGLRTQIGTLEGKLESLGQERNGLRRQIVALEGKLETLGRERLHLRNTLEKSKSEAEAKAGKMSGALKTAEEKAAKLAAENRKLGTELASAKTALNEAEKKIRELSRKIQSAGDSGNRRTAVTVPDLGLPFVRTEPSRLSSRLSALFADLREMGDEPDRREASYRKIEEDRRAALATTIRFEGGTTEIGKAEIEELRGALRKADVNTQFLVVAYASQDGDPMQNAVVASKRASTVARHLAGKSKDPENRVQAAYFGQTSRFSTENRSLNRVVEVWRVD